MPDETAKAQISGPPEPVLADLWLELMQQEEEYPMWKGFDETPADFLRRLLSTATYLEAFKTIAVVLLQAAFDQVFLEARNGLQRDLTASELKELDGFDLGPLYEQAHATTAPPDSDTGINLFRWPASVPLSLWSWSAYKVDGQVIGGYLRFTLNEPGHAIQLENRVHAMQDAAVRLDRAMAKGTFGEARTACFELGNTMDQTAEYCRGLARMLDGKTNDSAEQPWQADGGRLRQAIGLPDPPVAVLHPDDDPASGAAVLHPNDLKILQALAKAKTTQGQYDLEQTTGLSRRTISARLQGLRDGGLTERPKGKRGGEAITNKGRAALPQDEQAAH